MTTQEAYEKMVAHFSKPGAELARDGQGGACYYRRHAVGSERRYSPVRCAVGCLVPNTLYDEHFEDCGLTYDMAQAFGLTNVGARFLLDAQCDHDASDTRDAAHFVEKLHATARCHDLDVIA